MRPTKMTGNLILGIATASFLISCQKSKPPAPTQAGALAKRASPGTMGLS
jgi:hypothetical protein